LDAEENIKEDLDRTQNQWACTRRKSTKVELTDI